MGAPEAALRDALQAAIQRGAPIYNQGDHAGCYRLYRATAESLLEWQIARGEVDDILRQALDAAAKSANADRAAWAMRHAFDRLLQLKPRQAALFCGTVTTANNGGFASIRSAGANWGAAGAAGLRLLVQGDGRQYKVTVKTDDRFDSVVYQRDFVPAAGPHWTQVELPLSTFVPSWRAQVVPSAPPLDGDSIRQLGFMVSKFAETGGVVPGFQPGEFQLAVRWVKAYA